MGNWVFLLTFGVIALLIIIVLVIYISKSVRAEKEVMKAAFMDALKVDRPLHTPEWYEAQWDIFCAKIDSVDRPVRRDSDRD